MLRPEGRGWFYSYLAKHAEGYTPPALRRKTLVHGHGHHKSIMGVAPERTLLQQMELDFGDFVPASCCGVAGAFGFEKEHYDVSIKAGEHALLPRAIARKSERFHLRGCSPEPKSYRTFILCLPRETTQSATLPAIFRRSMTRARQRASSTASTRAWPSPFAR